MKIRKPSVSVLLNTNVICDHKTDPNSKTTVLREFDVLKRLRCERDTIVAFEYFKSVANSNSFKHTSLTYQTMIEKLGRDNEMDGVQYLLQQMKLDGISCSEDVFICVIKSYGQARAAELALKTFYRMQDFGCKPTVKIYNHVLDALLSENRFQMINPIYNNMKKDGVEPNVFTYNILLKALCKNKRVDAAHKLLVEMYGKGCSPDEVSYTTMISSLCQLGKLEEARELVMRINPAVPSYNALINGLCQERKIKDAFLVIHEMLNKEMDRSLGPILDKILQITAWEIIVYKEHLCLTGMKTNQHYKIWMPHSSKGFDFCMELLNPLEPSHREPLYCHQNSWRNLSLVSGSKPSTSNAVARIKISCGPHNTIKS